MIWLLTKVFSPLAPIFHFIGDHRYGSIAVLLVVAAGAAWVYVPVAGRNIAKVLIVLAVAAGFYDGGYSHRAAIDREAWAQAEQAQRAAELAEHLRREAVISKAKAEAIAEARAQVALEAEQNRILKESEDASRVNDHSACLPAASILRLNKIR
jgi:hypothetical protein